jgi:hypothetical protein
MTYTFDHLPDPPQSLEAMRRMLDPESGVLILEVHDLDRILARGESCLFEHEHTIYCSASTLQGLLARSGFALVSIDLVPEAARRANSLLAAAAPSGSRWAASAMPPLPPGPFGTVDACVRAGQDVQRALERIRTWITSRMAGGVRLAGYGAGGRGVMTLAAVARSGDFAFVCDANPALHGLRCPGSDVVVVPPDRLADAPVDEVLVFSFGYLDEIAASLAGFRLRGGRLVSLLDVMAG